MTVVSIFVCECIYYIRVHVIPQLDIFLQMPPEVTVFALKKRIQRTQALCFQFRDYVPYVHHVL